MDAEITFEITQAEDLKDPISEMLDAIKEQLIHLVEVTREKAKKALLVIMLSCTMSPVLAVPVRMDSVVDCTEIVAASSTQKYLDKLDEIALLEDDWDGEGAKSVNEKAIDNVRHLIDNMPQSILFANLKLFPSELGAVSMKLESSKGKLRAEIGDSIFSYYVRRTGIKNAEHHSFEEWNDSSIANLVSSLSGLV